MALEALARHFHLTIPDVAQDIPLGAAQNVTLQSIAQSYNPIVDTQALKASPSHFEALRNNYDYRHEVKDLNF